MRTELAGEAANTHKVWKIYFSLFARACGELRCSILAIFGGMRSSAEVLKYSVKYGAEHRQKIGESGNPYLGSGRSLLPLPRCCVTCRLTAKTFGREVFGDKKCSKMKTLKGHLYLSIRCVNSSALSHRAQSRTFEQPSY